MYHEINQIVMESEINVINALMESYNKALLILENYDGDDLSSFSIFQEGAFEDAVKEAKGSDSDSILKRILFFIPKFLYALVKNMTKIDKKDIEVSINNIQDFEKNLDKLSSEEKIKYLEMINSKLDNDEHIFIDKKTGKLRYKKDVNWDLHASTLLASFNLFTRLQKEFDPMNDKGVIGFIDEINGIIHQKDKHVSGKTVHKGLSAALNLFSDFVAMNAEFNAVAKELSNSIKKMSGEDMLKNKTPEERKKIINNASKLSQKISELTTTVAQNMGIFSPLIQVGNIIECAMGSFLKQKNIDDKLMDNWKKQHKNDDEYINLSSKDRENKLNLDAAIWLKQNRKQVSKDYFEKAKTAKKLIESELGI